MLRTIRTSARVLALTAGFVAVLAGGMAAQEASPVGDWEGAINAGGQEFPLAFHITVAEDGSLAATLDSPSQGQFGVPLEEVDFVEGVFTFAIAAAQASYEGTLSEDGSTLTGTWSQAGNSVELNMVKEDG